MKVISFVIVSAALLSCFDLAQAAAPKIKGTYAFMDYFVDCPTNVKMVGHRSISTGTVTISGAADYKGTVVVNGVKLQFNPTATLNDNATFPYSNTATAFTAFPGQNSPDKATFHASYGNIQNGVAGTMNAIRLDTIDVGCVETLIFTQQ